MDRFMFKLIVDYPTNEELMNIVRMTQKTMEETAEAVISGEEILEMRALAAEVPICDEVLYYAVNLVSNTHPASADCALSAKKYLKYCQILWLFELATRSLEEVFACALLRFGELLPRSEQLGVDTE